MQNKPSNIQITSSKIQFTPPQTFKYHNELQKQSYIMKNNKNITGPDCPGPNCPPPKSGKLGPGQMGPGAKGPIFRCPKMGLRVPESKNGDHFYKPNIPQN